MFIFVSTKQYKMSRNIAVNVIKRFKWGVRGMSSASDVIIKPEITESKSNLRKMSGFQIHSYGEISELQHTEHVKKPYIRKPSEVLVKITASSVNPLDVAMINGYGATLLNTMRFDRSDIEFPLTLGRDFVGTVVQKGFDIQNSDLKLGDKIWGVVPVHQQGCHAEYVIVDKCYVSKKPANLSDVDASAVLYAGLTAWSGLFVTGQLGGLLGAVCSSGGGSGKKVLVLGGSGGVGNLAVQMLLAEGVEVVTTCSTDAVPMMLNLGVSKVVDYTSEDSDVIMVSESPYDIILDCAGKGSEYAATLPWSFKDYITFNSPILKNFDAHGLISGGIRNAKDLLSNNMTSLNNNGFVKWGYFLPAPNGIEYLKKLAENKKLIPLIDSVYSFENLIEAYKRVENGHLRGKVIIDYTKK